MWFLGRFGFFFSSFGNELRGEEEGIIMLVTFQVGNCGKIIYIPSHSKEADLNSREKPPWKLYNRRLSNSLSFCEHYTCLESYDSRVIEHARIIKKKKEELH